MTGFLKIVPKQQRRLSYISFNDKISNTDGSIANFAFSWPFVSTNWHKAWAKSSQKTANSYIHIAWYYKQMGQKKRSFNILAFVAFIPIYETIFI